MKGLLNLPEELRIMILTFAAYAKTPIQPGRDLSSRPDEQFLQHQSFLPPTGLFFVGHGIELEAMKAHIRENEIEFASFDDLR